MKKRYVIGISGASGSILAVKLIREIAGSGHSVDVVISSAGAKTLYHEVGTASVLSLLPDHLRSAVHIHGIRSIESPLASGSQKIDATIIIPCSMSTIAALSIGLGDNLLRRAADVALKEKRPLILVPRETPLHSIHLENLLRLSQAGATILPPMPMWYLKPQTADDIENALVGKILSMLDIPSVLSKKWEGWPYLEKEKE